MHYFITKHFSCPALSGFFFYFKNTRTRAVYQPERGNNGSTRYPPAVKVFVSVVVHS